MTRATAQEKAEFIFQYFLDRSFGSDGHGKYCSTHLTAIPTWDDGMDFAVDFESEFPGNKPDPNHKLASARLSKILKRLADDKWLDRWRLGNEIDCPGTPKWQYNYKLTQWLINGFKTGRYTPRSAAVEWGGEFTSISRKVYLAHPVTDYGTDRQSRAIKTIEDRGWQVENPDQPHHHAAYLEQGMEYFTRLVKTCDGLAFVTFHDGAVGAGVAGEIMSALDEKLPVYDVSDGSARLVRGLPRLCLTVSQTRARLTSIRKERQ